jgi:hemerythrin-like domain-containing protein
MSDIIARLRKDHSNIDKILTLLEGQLGVFRRGSVPDYALMIDAMRYLVQYHDLFHHPREDVLLGRLGERHASARPIVDELGRQHASLAQGGKLVLESLQGVESEEIISRDALASQCRDYITLLRRHMRQEEAELFPLALNELDRRDWDAIAAATTAQAQDPVFGGEVAAEYRGLYHYLVQQR